MLGIGISAGSIPAALALSISLACLISWDRCRFDMMPSFGGLPGPFRFSTTWPMRSRGKLCFMAISSVIRPSMSPASSSPSCGLRNIGGLSLGGGLPGCSAFTTAGASFTDSSTGVSALTAVFEGALAGALPLSLGSFDDTTSFSFGSFGSLGSFRSLCVFGSFVDTRAISLLLAASLTLILTFFGGGSSGEGSRCSCFRLCAFLLSFAVGGGGLQSS